MGASISFDSKYRLILDVEVECISADEPSNNRGDGSNKKKDNRRHEDDASDASDASDTSDDENKTYTVKITPEIAGYIRNYLRKNTFLDEFDLITEIDLEKYKHAPGSALVFNSDSVVYITNKQTIESVGEWEYIEPEPVTRSSSSSSKNKKHHRNRENNENDEYDNYHLSNNRSGNNYNTKDDNLPVSQIRDILTEKFQEYNKSREFVIHQGKNSFLVLLITSVRIEDV